MGVGRVTDLKFLSRPMNNAMFRKVAYEDFDRTESMFNESMRLCLK